MALGAVRLPGVGDEPADGAGLGRGAGGRADHDPVDVAAAGVPDPLDRAGVVGPVDDDAAVPAGGVAGAVLQLQALAAGRDAVVGHVGLAFFSINKGGAAPARIQTGVCAPGPDPATGETVAFGAAGGHFDPGQSRNHGRPGEPINHAHAGELPNITVGADGRGSLRYLNPNVTLSPAPHSAFGRSLVVHERADDFVSDPAGNSGGRLLCGVIESEQPGPVIGRAVIDSANAPQRIRLFTVAPRMPLP